MVLISPFSRRLRDGKPCPKDYPYWKEVTHILQRYGVESIQIGLKGEEEIGASFTAFNNSFKELKTLLDKCETWVSVDNFFQHFAHPRKGIVLWGPSNPFIFGYDFNINLYKDKNGFRANQFDWYYDIKSDNFVDVKTVVDAIMNELRRG